MAKRKSRPAKRRSNTKPSYQVFVSHATAAKWVAKTFCEKIEEIGASTFRDDRDINGGDDIPEEIRTQIQQSRELIVLLTPKSIVHGFFWKWEPPGDGGKTIELCRCFTT